MLGFGAKYCGACGVYIGVRAREDREQIVTNFGIKSGRVSVDSVMNTVETMMTSSLMSLVGPTCQSEEGRWAAAGLLSAARARDKDGFGPVRPVSHFFPIPFCFLKFLKFITFKI